MPGASDRPTPFFRMELLKNGVGRSEKRTTEKRRSEKRCRALRTQERHDRPCLSCVRGRAEGKPRRRSAARRHAALPRDIAVTIIQNHRSRVRPCYEQRCEGFGEGLSWWMGQHTIRNRCIARRCGGAGGGGRGRRPAQRRPGPWCLSMWGVY